MTILNKDNYLKRLNKIIVDAALSEPDDPDSLATAFYSGHNIIGNLFGTGSSEQKVFHDLWHKNIKYVVRDHPSYKDEFAERKTQITAFLQAVKGDLENDLISNVMQSAFGAVIEDFIVLARSQLEAGYKDVAAVLACAAFEDAMKRKARSLNLDIEGKELSDVINALKSSSVFRGAQTTLVSGFVRLRNDAMHASWEKVREPEVSSLIAFTEGFLLNNFS